MSPRHQMPQNAAAVLNEALGRTGAASLPYAEEFRALVQQHMTDLVTDLPSLHIKVREYIHINGSAVLLLLAEGTLPMYYQAHKYNIPVAIWIPEHYPLAAPMAYVVPTSDMVIKPRHKLVDTSGFVRTPYIGQWQYPASNLRDMAQDMSMHFGGDPPLFSKPKNWNACGGSSLVTAAQPLPQPSVSPYGGGSATGDILHVHNPLAQTGPSFSSFSGNSFSSSSSHPKPAPSSYVSSSNDISGGFESVLEAMMGAQQQQQQAVPPAAIQQPPPVVRLPTISMENLSAKLAVAFHTAAMASLNKRLHASLAAVAQQAVTQAQEQLELQGTLKQRGIQLQSEVAALQAERVALDKLSQELATSSSHVDRWLTENEHLAKAADASQLDADAVISAADPLSQQALEVQAQDLALEDTLYALEKSLNQGTIEPDVHLKQVRAVCRRQFFVRVCGNKVAAAQQEQQRKVARLQQQVPRPQPDVQRSLSTGRPVMLPQGDSWTNAGIIANSREPAGGTAWYPAS